MTRDRDIPDRWQGPKSTPGQPNGRRSPNNNGTRPLSPPKKASQGQPSQAPGRQLSTPVEAAPQAANLDLPDPPSKMPKLLQGRFNNFGLRFWAILIVLLSTGVGLSAVALLLKLPAVPNCPATFWPTASASMRLYCAQLAANKQTAEDLLQAIALVEDLPTDHPLRPEINRHIEEWSQDILNIGDQKFQAGKLEEAIKIAQRIPAGVSAQKLVDQKIEKWKTIWSGAQAIFDKTEQQLRKSNWVQAFREAVKMTAVDNKYWATVKYEQLTKLIELAKVASAQLDKAHELSKSDAVDDIVAAIKQAEKISPQSYAYQEAQKLIAESGKKLLKIADYRLEQRDGKGVLEVATKIPASVKMQAQKNDLINLGNALTQAAAGNAAGLEAAIASAQQVASGRPLFAKGQVLLARWQREVQDITQLEKARTFASSGLVPDLRTAINEAKAIPSGNPRYSEASTEISKWSRQVETIEDQPVLDRATQLANFGGQPSLQEAINEASRIGKGRTLYRQAQEKIGQWTNSIQRQQDQPFLDQARNLASVGNIPAAISTAQQIRSGRSLYQDAQNDIETWQAETRGQQRLQEANLAASSGTTDGLGQAIKVARQVPSSSSARSDAREMVNRWSNQLLAIAQDRSSYNIREAINIAKLIPSSAQAYDAAQSQIQDWQRILEPPPPPPAPVPSSEVIPTTNDQG
ncbi:MAG: chromosome segregation ATPase [Coleofasciculaceae cyanobacterium]